MVLYGIFAPRFIQGSLFPEIKSAEAFETFAHFAAQTEPKTNTGIAKALVWAFIAGLSERFVPNFINKIARQDDAESN